MDASTIPEALRLGGAIVTALIYYLRANRNFQPIGKRRAKEHESLDFISSFLAFDISRRSRLVVEHAFEIYLRKRLSFEEIQALLLLSNPLHAMRMFSKVGQYISFNSETKQFEYRSFVSTGLRRAIHQVINLGGYFLFSIVGVLVFLYSPEFIGGKNPLGYLPLGLVALALLFMSYLFLEDGTSLTMASKFLKEAEKKNS